MWKKKRIVWRVADCSSVAWTPQQCTNTLPKTFFRTFWFSILYEECSEMIWTVAAVSVNKRLKDRAHYHRTVQSQYSVPPSNGPQSCLHLKNCSLVNKSSGRGGWTRVIKWKAIIRCMDRSRVSRVKQSSDRQIFIVGHLQFVEKQHLHAALCSTWNRAFTVSSKLPEQLSVCLSAISPHSLRLVLYSHAEDTI
jgi:hypothetical protein